MESSSWTLPQRIAALDAADHWQGTPHRNRIAVHGVGIDCLHFVREILIASNKLPTFRFPFYAPAWGIGRTTNIVADMFALCCYCDRLPPTSPVVFGDIAIFAVGHQSNHVGIVLDDGFVWHVRANEVVRPEHIDDIRPHLEALIRLTADGFKRTPESITTDELKPKP